MRTSQATVQEMIIINIRHKSSIHGIYMTKIDDKKKIIDKVTLETIVKKKIEYNKEVFERLAEV